VTVSDSGPILDLLAVYGSAIGTPYLNSAQGITAQDINWGSCAANHVYSLTTTGNGGNIGFVVSDEFWGDPGVFCSSSFCQNNGTFDNSGSLTVKIFQVLAVPSNKDDCKQGGWQGLTRTDGSHFKNQGDCIQYVNTGK